MTSYIKRYLGFAGLLIIALGLFMLWYKYQYSMDEASPREIRNPAEYNTHVLIATQGSEYKDAILDEVLKRLQHTEYYIKVIDVQQLYDIDIADWDAIAVIHTWEMWKAPTSVQAFIQSNLNNEKIVTLTTSGSGDETAKMEGIDGITSASVMTNIESVADQLVSKLKSAVRNA